MEQELSCCQFVTARFVRVWFIGSMILPVVVSCASAAEPSASAWDSAEFRIWGFVPYWASQTQVNSFSPDGVYDHVSDVLYFSGVQPTANGNLSYHPRANGHLAALRSHAAAHEFRLHMSMFDVSGGSVDDVWNSIVGNSTNRANFVSNVVDLLDANNMVGFNLDWERPSTDTEWANYTQLAKDLKAALGPIVRYRSTTMDTPIPTGTTPPYSTHAPTTSSLSWATITLPMMAPDWTTRRLPTAN